MARTIQFDLRSLSPFRQPEWRWLGARKLQDNRLRPRAWEDPCIADAARYMSVLEDKGVPAARRKWPALFAAHGIYTASGDIRDELEARMVAREAGEVIADKMGLTVAMITTFATYFFDLPAAPAGDDWLMTEVVKLRPGQTVTEGQIWKYVAMAGGPVLVDLLVDDYLGRPCTNPDERSELAAKGRYIAREYATDWSSMLAVRAIVEEGCRLFPHLGRSINGTREEKLVAVHLQIVRMAAGLESLPEQETESSAPGPIGARKEFSHGRPQTSKT